MKKAKGKRANNDKIANKENEDRHKKTRINNNCETCNQNLNEVIKYKRHPINSEAEIITLTYPSLRITKENSQDGKESDKILYKITHFNVYDQYGHLCPLDTGIIESGKYLNASGYVKLITDEDPSILNGIPTHSIGPLEKWYILGFDGGKNSLIGFSTEQADYYLVEPSLEYKPLMATLEEKTNVTKVVIEFLLERVWDSPCYEDLLQLLELHTDLGVTEEILIKHAQFICNQVMSFDAAGSSGDDILMTTPCMRSLAQNADVDLANMQQELRQFENKVVRVRSETVSTDLVNDVFETFFKNQLKKKDKINKNTEECGVCDSCQAPDYGTCTPCYNLQKSGVATSSKKKCDLHRCSNLSSNGSEHDKKQQQQECGTCNSCQTPDCGTCAVCRNLRKYDGAGTSSQKCKMRKCSNSSFKNENEKKEEASEKPIRVVEWTGTVINTDHGRTYYTEALVDKIKVRTLDCVMLNSGKENQPLLIAQIVYMWEEDAQQMFHARLFCRSQDTILGDISNPRELFMVDVCEEYLLNSIVSKAKVVQRRYSKNWSSKGGEDKLEPQLKDNGVDYFYRYFYDSKSGSFESIIEENNELQATSCSSCSNRANKAALEVPMFKEDTVYWMGEEYKIGSGVFIEPHTIIFRRYHRLIPPIEDESVDGKTYPEYYRKSIGTDTSLNIEPAPSPFNIGLILKINVDCNKDIQLTVRTFYRPEDTRGGPFAAYTKDLNFLYWSNDVYIINFKEVKGKCYLAYHKSLTSAREWSKHGSYRFYYNEVYEKNTENISELQEEAVDVPEEIGTNEKQKGKVEEIPSWIRTEKPLACMDVFSGCGGLSEGLRASGVADIKWAIDSQPAAAHAFKLNHPNTTVYTADCNELLKNIMEGKMFNDRKLPKKHEVEMIVGGLPCQGFSKMNRFSFTEHSSSLNLLIIPFLSYCDYFRPKYVILENVANFTNHVQNILFKTTIVCFLEIGYQVTFGILQAGNYGVPQDRRRFFIIAAAPDCVLPQFPEPQNVFIKANSRWLPIIVDNIKYYTGVKWWKSAPYRTLTVRDALTDLPDIESGCDDNQLTYEDTTVSHYQRLLRPLHNLTVRDHITRALSPLVESRISHIPPYPGSDWRDLPNIIVKLRDGSFTDVLKYRYRSHRQSKGPRRGVCICCTREKCNPADRQSNTLIPWSLPHTAHRHNNWVGVYGRLDWNGIFNTTVTNPEPISIQGKVLHPDQPRIISIRECARSQGFPDEYLLYGDISDKYRQIGNAVPPPLALELGREIQKAVVASAKQS